MTLLSYKVEQQSSTPKTLQLICSSAYAHIMDSILTLSKSIKLKCMPKKSNQMNGHARTTTSICISSIELEHAPHHQKFYYVLSIKHQTAQSGAAMYHKNLAKILLATN